MNIIQPYKWMKEWHYNVHYLRTHYARQKGTMYKNSYSRWSCWYLYLRKQTGGWQESRARANKGWLLPVHSVSSREGDVMEHSKVSCQLVNILNATGMFTWKGLIWCYLSVMAGFKVNLSQIRITWAGSLTWGAVLTVLIAMGRLAHTFSKQPGLKKECSKMKIFASLQQVLHR